MRKRLYKEVKRDTYRKMIYTKKKLYKKGRGYIQLNRENSTKPIESCNKLIAIYSKLQ